MMSSSGLSCQDFRASPPLPPCWQLEPSQKSSLTLSTAYPAQPVTFRTTPFSGTSPSPAAFTMNVAKAPHQAQPLVAVDS
eukprot:CAMPEP_0115145274 /NCGR_PEP_ID=MMETSP0227-20121206/62017_1 /TAXON_ID=89957 /ORGANISM="Polarella glacialis, Strain CCMP 1383" /LENGTH=79 /DNA_ID=CAMNT_0002554759 /DNA_START=206 /DNA_END=445 /DNA_ORIENTATION=+